VPKNDELDRRKKDAKWMRTDLVRLATSSGALRLGEEELRVAMFLLGKLNYRKEKHIRVDAMADQLGIDQRRVSKILTHLRKVHKLLADPVRREEDRRNFLRRLRQGNVN
jgi:DNA-binding MarR family transcriptional regulator